MAKFDKQSLCQKHFFGMRLLYAHAHYICIVHVRVRATGRNCRQMQRKNIFGTKKIYLAKTSGEKKFSEKNRHLNITDLGYPIPYFSIINVHLVDINVFAKSDEIPSLPVQVIKEKPKCCRLRITKGNNSKGIGP